MKIKNFLIGSVLVCFLFSCGKEKVNKVNTEIHSKISVSYINKLLIKSINDGDFKAYNEVSSYYILEDKIPDFYFYALIMANKHECPEAYYHLYTFLTNEILINDINLYSSDERTKHLAIYYLLKSYELGYKEAAPKLEDIFGKKFPKSYKFNEALAK